MVMRVRRPNRMNRRARLTARWRASATVRCSAWVMGIAGSRAPTSHGRRPHLAGSGLELVAQAPHGGHVAGVGGVDLDLGPEPAHVDVDEAAVAEVVVAPDPFEELLAAE